MQPTGEKEGKREGENKERKKERKEENGRTSKVRILLRNRKQ